jgi:hypothetical protein
MLRRNFLAHISKQAPYNGTVSYSGSHHDLRRSRRLLVGRVGRRVAGSDICLSDRFMDDSESESDAVCAPLYGGKGVAHLIQYVYGIMPIQPRTHVARPMIKST